MNRAESKNMLRLGRARIEPARTLAAHQSALMVVVLLPLAAGFGCQSVTTHQGNSPLEPPMATMEEPSASSPMLQNSTPIANSLPTDPEPLPELDSSRTVNIHLDLGRVFQSKGQLQSAEAEYRRSLEGIDRKVDRTNQAEVHRRLASVLDRQGKFHESQTHYDQATSLTPRDPRIWNDYGYSAYLQGDWEQAIDRLRKAEKLDKTDSRTLTNLGLALAAAGKQDEAVEVFTRAGGPAAARANLAYILAATGQTEQARQQYEETLQLNPGDSLARAALGKLDASEFVPTEAIASRPAPVDPAVSPASFESNRP
jgi:Tfp pilus assembly protein PilF